MREQFQAWWRTIASARMSYGTSLQIWQAAYQAGVLAERDALTAELRLRNKSASDRLHNICRALEDECDGSAFSREEWDRIDAENTSLTVENNSLRADAERYRFWRKYYRSQFLINGKHSLRFMPSRPTVEIAGQDYEKVVDAAIDAARGQK
jgi:hypothetical protein